MARIHPSMALRPAVEWQDQTNPWPSISFPRNRRRGVGPGESGTGCRSLCLEGVTVYHHLLFDSANHVERIQSVDAENDDDAKIHAARLLPSVGRIIAVEVWQGQRRVYRVQNPPSDNSA